MILLLACVDPTLMDSGSLAVEPLALDGVEYTLEWTPRETLENDLGWSVELTEAHLSDWSVALVPCDLPSKGHGEEVDDSTLIGPFESSMTGSWLLGAVDFDAGWYCQVHVLAAAEEETLRVAGRATREGLSIPFEASTDRAYGALYDLGAVQQQADPLTLASLTLTRDVGTMFHGIDFGSEEDLAWAILHNLYDRQEVGLRLSVHDHAHP